MAKEPMFVENLKAWIDEIKELYYFVLPPKTRAFLNSALNTFISAFFSSLVTLYLADQIKPTIFKDGTWTLILLSTIYSSGAVTIREIIKRVKKEYNYEELEKAQDEWKTVTKDAKKKLPPQK